MRLRCGNEAEDSANFVWLIKTFQDYFKHHGSLQHGISQHGAGKIFLILPLRPWIPFATIRPHTFKTR